VGQKQKKFFLAIFGDIFIEVIVFHFFWLHAIWFFSTAFFPQTS